MIATHVTGSFWLINNDIQQDGNVLAVRLCARFQGWELWAKNGALVIELGDEGLRY